MFVLFFSDVLQTQPAEVKFANCATHVIASHALLNRWVTFRAALVPSLLAFRPSLVVHALTLVDSPAFKAHDSGAGGTHGVFGATTFRLGHNGVAVSNRTPLEIATVSSNLHVFLLVLPHVHNPLITKAFQVWDFEFLVAFFLETRDFLPWIFHACYQMILHTVHTKAVVALQGEEIGFFVRIKANIALGSPHCNWNHSDKLFDFIWSRDYWKRGEIIIKVIIKKIAVKIVLRSVDKSL